MDKSKILQNKSFDCEPESSLISVFRTNNSSKDQSVSPKNVKFDQNVADTDVKPTVYTYKEKN